MVESNTVTAIRNGKTAVFTRRVWDIIGTDKYGWVEIVLPPDEVSRAPAPTVINAPNADGVIANPHTKHKHKRRK